MADGAAGLRAVEAVLRCPVCTADLRVAPDSGSLVCDDAGHRFDIARQGYVSLLDGRAGHHLSDTAAMVAARRRVHASGVFDSVADTVADLVASTASTDGPDMMVDAGAGTGHYLARCLDRTPTARGLGIDLSKYCARAIAKVHPRSAAVVADIWRPLPIASGSVGAILSIFSPRNVAEFGRVLHRDGVLAVVTPNADHLAEIVDPMGMLAVGADKDERLQAALDDVFAAADTAVVRTEHELGAAAIADLVAMGPSAFHATSAEIDRGAQAVAGQGATLPVTVSVTVTTWRPR
ncbi:putative RNA methyltransferase [Gordonia sp. CPCC 206044]|uniref:putative RNA methyltransferase n=1 Tax=Gordonia sp. CPCC 206044 TaxID=3140793 RepID=UPI003AF3D453